MEETKKAVNYRKKPNVNLTWIQVDKLNAYFSCKKLIICRKFS